MVKSKLIGIEERFRPVSGHCQGGGILPGDWNPWRRGHYGLSGGAGAGINNMYRDRWRHETLHLQLFGIFQTMRCTRCQKVYTMGILVDGQTFKCSSTGECTLNRTMGTDRLEAPSASACVNQTVEDHGRKAIELPIWKTIQKYGAIKYMGRALEEEIASLKKKIPASDKGQNLKYLQAIARQVTERVTHYRHMVE